MTSTLNGKQIFVISVLVLVIGLLAGAGSFSLTTYNAVIRNSVDVDYLNEWRIEQDKLTKEIHEKLGEIKNEVVRLSTQLEKK